jgi:2-polyprenyl-3-methyl-5-hydroxy-6-metoxy-1,4-benzoquinol methylase
MKKYYIEEHEATYKMIKEQGLKAWDQFHAPMNYTFDNFMMRPFLERALTLLSFDAKPPRAFEYGCGTGAGACFLASKGFEVEAIDICSTAIELAKQLAYERGFQIRYEVQDITEFPYEGKEYDLILDNYCLQSVVTDTDRELLFSNILKRLKPTGYYVIATAMFNSERKYKNSCYDSKTGILYERVNDNPSQYKDSIEINNCWWIPNRRHLTSTALYEELTSAGFKVVFQEEGNLICKSDRI